jgi:hypothetical protein
MEQLPTRTTAARGPEMWPGYVPVDFEELDLPLDRRGTTGGRQDAGPSYAERFLGSLIFDAKKPLDGPSLTVWVGSGALSLALSKSESLRRPELSEGQELDDSDQIVETHQMDADSWRVTAEAEARRQLDRVLKSQPVAAPALAIAA